ncbi:DUF748 domain-containing protein [Thalassotalea sp. PLHSN55]|uniref:DUF748 domain-containing protein n=1 Tax=Thalassotalea sp. PLHSN55 TaxID=3435888 RepID=UPI003F8622D6
MLSSIKKLIKITFFIYLIIYSLVWLISPTVVRHFLSDYLSSQQLVLAEQSSIRYNPFLSHLSIRDLSISKQQAPDTPVASLDTLDLEVRLYQFIFDEIYISEFIIDGLHLTVSANDELVEVSGFVVSDANAEVTETDQAPNAEPNSQAETEFPYRLNLPKLTLKNSAIELFVQENSHRLKLKSLVLSDLGATLIKQQLMLAIDSEVNQSKLSLNVEADMNQGAGKIIVDLGLDKVKLARFKHFLPADIEQLDGLLSYQAKHEISLSGEDVFIDFKNLLFALEDVAVSQNELFVHLAKQELSSEALSLSLLKDKVPLVEGMLQFSLAKVKAFYQEENNVLAQLESLAINDINLEKDNEINTVSIADINFSQVAFSDNITDQIPALAGFDSLNIKQINASEKGVAVDVIQLSGLAVNAQLDSDKNLVNLVQLPASETDEGEPETADEQPTTPVINEQPLEVESKATPSFAIKLNQFSFADEGHIFFKDSSVEPIFERSITITELTAGAFDNQTPELESLFKIVGKSEKYAHFDFGGKVQPFLAKPFYSLKGAFKEVSLPSISPYIKDALQHEIESGQLDLALDVSLTGTELDGDADVLLRGIEFTAADDHETGTIKDQTSVPFNVALGMLKDSDGNVELSLPLSGDVSSPDFGLSGLMTLLVKQATMSAAKDYLMTTFVPYASVVNIALAAGEFALKVRFNDLVFPVTETELQAQHDEFLSQFSALLTDKDDVQVKLCAIATPADIGKPLGTEITNKEEIKQLATLSEQRIHAFKDYMVEQKKLKSSRLLLCKPQVDFSEEAKPRISFGT